MFRIILRIKNPAQNLFPVRNLPVKNTLLRQHLPRKKIDDLHDKRCAAVINCRAVQLVARIPRLHPQYLPAASVKHQRDGQTISGIAAHRIQGAQYRKRHAHLPVFRCKLLQNTLPVASGILLGRRQKLQINFSTDRILHHISPKSIFSSM